MGDQDNETPMTEERLECYSLPDDPVAALNILFEAAGLEPWPGQSNERVETMRGQCPTCVPPDADHSVQAWAGRHRRVGHHPHPAPTKKTRRGGTASAATCGAS